MTLPPGQQQTDGFPRFGTHLAHSAPAVPLEPVIEISGAVANPCVLSLDTLAGLSRRNLTADFHCVAGWSATDLRWQGVAFRTFYRKVIEPFARPDSSSVTHVVFGGLDGYRSVVEIEDSYASAINRVGLGLLLKRHPRARVWEEERHRHLPAWSVRTVYRMLSPPIMLLSDHGTRRSDASVQDLPEP